MTAVVAPATHPVIVEAWLPHGPERLARIVGDAAPGPAGEPADTWLGQVGKGDGGGTHPVLWRIGTGHLLGHPHPTWPVAVPLLDDAHLQISTTPATHATAHHLVEALVARVLSAIRPGLVRVHVWDAREVRGSLPGLYPLLPEGLLTPHDPTQLAGLLDELTGRITAVRSRVLTAGHRSLRAHADADNAGVRAEPWTLVVLFGDRRNLPPDLHAALQRVGRAALPAGISLITVDVPVTLPAHTERIILGGTRNRCTMTGPQARLLPDLPLDPRRVSHAAAAIATWYAEWRTREALFRDLLPAEHGGCTSAESVAAPIGFDEHGAPVVAELGDATPHALVGGPSGTGKALDVDTPIATPDGWTTMGELRLGDAVFDDLGQPCRVLMAHQIMYDRPCYAVEFSDGSTIIADAEHLWATETLAARASQSAARTKPRKRQVRISDYAAAQLRQYAAEHPVATRGEFLTALQDATSGTYKGQCAVHAVAQSLEPAGTKKVTLVHNYSGKLVQKSKPVPTFHTAELLDKLLAVTAQPCWDQRHHSVSGDAVRTTAEIAATLHYGSKVNHSVRVAGALQLSDATLPVPPYTLGAWLGDGAHRAGRVTKPDAQLFELIAADGYDIGPPIQMPGQVETRTIYGLQAQLRALDVLWPADKCIPTMYLRASETQRRTLLAGLLDTDGTAAPSGAVQYTSTSERLAGDVFELVVSLGYRPTLGKRPAKLNGIEYGTAYTISFTTRDDVFRLERKRDALCGRAPATAKSTTGRRMIVAIRPVPTRPVRCITVDSPSRLYLAGRTMIPTHNTNLILAWLTALASRYSPKELALYLLDFKDGVSFAPLAGGPTVQQWLPHARLVGVNINEDREFGLALLRHLSAEMRRRAAAEKKAGATKLAELRRHDPAGHWPRIIAVIDEAQALLEPRSDPVTQEAVELIEDIARRGRSHGIHLVLASQNLGAVQALWARPAILEQFSLRIGLPRAKGVFADTNRALDDLPRHHAIVNSEGGVEYGNVVARVPNACAPGTADQAQAELYERWGDPDRRPVLMDGDVQPAAASLWTDSGDPRVTVGRAFDIAGGPATARLDAMPGRNLAVLGAGAHHAPRVLSCAAAGLARQGAALDLVTFETLGGAHADWVTAHAPDARRVDTASFSGHLAALVQDIGDRLNGAPRPPRAVAIWEVDAIESRYDRAETDLLRTVIHHGPEVGIHVLGWWRSVDRLLKLLYVGDATTEDVGVWAVCDVIGSSIGSAIPDMVASGWEPRPDRGFLYDREQAAAGRQLFMVPTLQGVSDA